jgi:hypothetical protein
MRAKSCLLTGLLSFVCCSVALAQLTPAPSKTDLVPSAATRLVGTWEAAKRSYGGISVTAIFSPEGVVSLVLGAMVDAKYNVEGDKFTLEAQDRGKSGREEQTLTFAGDTAVLSGHGCSMRLTRLESGASEKSLVGQWRLMHMTGVPAYEEFTPEGLVRLRVPMQVQKGLYSAEDKKLSLHILSPKAQDIEARFELEGDTLTLSNNGKHDRYVRARQLIPTDVQQPAPPSGMLC